MKIAVFCPNWVGDLLMATPSLRALRERYASARITAVLRPPLGEVLAGTGLVDDVVLHRPHGKVALDRGWGLWRRLRRERFDLAVLFPNSWRSGWWAWSIGARRRVGTDRNLRGWMLTDRVAASSRSIPSPVMREYGRIVEAIGCNVSGKSIESVVTPEDDSHLQAFWERSGVSPSEQSNYICLNTGGAFGPAKNWPVESFAELAQRVHQELHRPVLVVCGPAERENARAIVAHANCAGIRSLADEPPHLGLTKAAISRAAVLVTTDSGPRHFAPAFGVPVVTLFGPTHIAWSETGYHRSVHLQLAVDCGPCQQRVCPHGHQRCLRDLSPDTVFQAVKRQLAARQSDPVPVTFAA